MQGGHPTAVGNKIAWAPHEKPHGGDASKMVAMKKTQKTVEKHREHLLFHNRLGY